MKLVRFVLLFLIVLVTLAYHAQGKSDGGLPKEVFAGSESSCSH
jgi:hypothetical protein